MSKYILFVLGFLLVALGIGIVIKHWALRVLLQALGGCVVALVGLVMMFAASIKK